MTIDSKSIKAVSCISGQLKNQTVLVTGSTGMIGQNVVALLLSMNDNLLTNLRVIAHARNMDKAEEVFRSYHRRDDFECLFCDIREIKVTEHVDVIIHAAGVTGGSKQHLDFPMTTISVALDGTRRCLDLAKENNAKLVYLSSLEVYGLVNQESRVSESEGSYVNSMNPRSSYPESKRMCECMCAAYTQQFGTKTYVARLTSSFGKGVSILDNRVFAQFARSIIQKQDIILKSTGETVRSYCDVEDVATAILYIFVYGIPGEAYNVANRDIVISIKDLAEAFIQTFPESGSHLVFDLKEDVSKQGYNPTLRHVLNPDKLYKLGWKPSFGIETMVQHLVVSLKS